MDSQNNKTIAFIEKVKEKGQALYSKIRGKLLVRPDREKLFRQGLYFLFAFLLARGSWLFGCYPFGIALMASAGEYLWTLWAGCVIASFFVTGVSPFLFIAVYTLMLALRLHEKSEKKNAVNISGKGGTLPLRVMLSAVIGFIPGLYGCIAEGFTLHALFALLLYILSCGVFTFLYDGVNRGVAIGRIFKKAAYASLLFSLVYSMRSLSFFSFSPAAAMAVLLCLFCAGEEDFLSNGVLGLILGIAAGRSYAIPVALIGLISSAFMKYSKRLAPWLGLLGGFAYAFYNTGSSAFLYVLPDFVCGALIFTPIDLYLQKRKSAQKERKLRTASKEQEKSEDVASHLQTLGEKIASLSKELRAPGLDGALRAVGNAFEEVCPVCGKSCFESETKRKELASALREKGCVKPDDPPVKDLKGCKRKTLLCDSVNNYYAAYLRRLSESDRSGCYASCFESTSKMLRDREKRKEEDASLNEQDSAAFKTVMQSTSFRFSNAAVRGTGRQIYTLSGIDEEEFETGMQDFLAILSERTGKRFSTPVIKRSSGGTELSVFTLPLFSIKEGYACAAKPGEECCGDSVCFFTFDRCSYALICDGMGSGRDAALISRICCRFFKEMTEAGADIRTVIAAINDFLLFQNCEISSGFDLMRFDRYTGRCDFVKCGACASLVLRGGNTFKIDSPSVPLGGTRFSDYEAVTVKLREGDRVIMTSDGVSAEIEGSPWLDDLFKGKLRASPQALAEDILRSAELAGKTQDDRTALIADICLETTA